MSGEPPLPNPSPAEGERGSRKAPRWTIAFLRALERTGDVRASAEDAGIDHTTAYARRRAHPEFAGQWENALRLRSGRVEEEKKAELAAVEAAPPLPARAPRESPSPAEGGGAEELVVSGGQVKRAGHDRWNKRKEKIFFDELAATNNVRRSAKAAGVSPNAVHQRRLRDRHFAGKWAAVVRSGKAAIEMHLVETANRTFEPDELDTGGVEPKVSVAEAIRIVQTRGDKAQRQELADPYDEEAPSEQEIEEARDRLDRKLRRVRDREMPALFAKGWSFDEEHDQLVPPGWVRGGPTK